MIDLGQASFPDPHCRLVKVADLLKRYLDEVTPTKRGRVDEAIRVRNFLKQPFASVTLNDVTASMFSAYKDKRLNEVKPSTVRRELAILRSIINYGIREWGVSITENPISKIAIPSDGKSRTRRVDPEELDLLLSLSETRRAPFLFFGITIALETGMRRGELLSVLWSDLDLSRSLLRIRTTKNGHERVIPLSMKATKAFEELKALSAEESGQILPLSPNAFRLAWQRLKQEASGQLPTITSLRFHDFRHEAISRFFEKGLTVPEVALISGHRDVRMLFRYTHLKPESVLSKLH
jgi:integrase